MLMMVFALGALWIIWEPIQHGYCYCLWFNLPSVSLVHVGHKLAAGWVCLWEQEVCMEGFNLSLGSLSMGKVLFLHVFAIRVPDLGGSGPVWLGAASELFGQPSETVPLINFELNWQLLFVSLTHKTQNISSLDECDCPHANCKANVLILVYFCTPFQMHHLTHGWIVAISLCYWHEQYTDTI